MSHPPRVVAFIGIAVVLTLVAPLDTDDVMRAVPRLAYWTVLVVATYGIGFAAQCAVALGPWTGLLARSALSGLITGLGACAVVYLLNGLAFAYWPQGRELAVLAGNVFAISCIVSAIFQFAYAGHDTLQTAGGFTPLLERLPLEARGALVSLSSEDHYTRVRTTKGEALLLLRLGDAIRETEGTDGLHVHRSH